MRIKNIFFIALGTLALLLIPVLGNWPWTLSDFIIGAALIFGTGLVLELVLNKFGRYRAAAAVIVVVLFLWLWAELAVGVFTNWGS